MYRNQKGFARYNSISGFAHMLVLVIIVVAVGVGGYWMWRNDKLNITVEGPSPTPASNEITENMAPQEWITYESNFGWSIKYPQSWYIYDKGFKYEEDGEIKWWHEYGDILFSPEEFPEYIPEGTEVVFDGFAVEYANSNNFQDNLNFEDIYNESSAEQRQTIDGKRVVKRYSDTRSNEDLPDAYRGLSVTYFIEYEWKDKQILKLTANNINKSETLNEDFLNQILSTFEFIETCSFEDRTCPNGQRCILIDNLPGSSGTCTNEVPEPEKSCLDNEGIWLEKYSECENVTESQCKSMLGEFEECASNLGCRHKNSGKQCLPTAGCIKLCSF